MGLKYSLASIPLSLSFPIIAVKSIKKQQLVEVRSMGNPPRMVKMAMESICLLIGEPTKDWKSIRTILIRENFIPTIINFSTEDIT
jgi:dynein heavy chain 1